MSSQLIHRDGAPLSLREVDLIEVHGRTSLGVSGTRGALCWLTIGKDLLSHANRTGLAPHVQK